MAELINWHTAPLVVLDEKKKRHSIPASGSKEIDGDFSNHPFVKKGWLSVDGDRVSPELSDKEKLQQLRNRYKSIFGKSAPPAAKAEKLEDMINEWMDSEDEAEKKSTQSEKPITSNLQVNPIAGKDTEQPTKK